MTNKIQSNGDIKIFTKDEKERPLVGLVDAGHTILRCRNCDTPLADIWLNKPDIDVELDVMATCGVCDDQSWQVKVKGGFHLGVAVVDENGEWTPNDGKMFVTHESYDSEGEVIVIKTKKVENK